MVGSGGSLGEFFHFVFFVWLIALASGILIFSVLVSVFTDRLAFAGWRISASVSAFVVSAAPLPLWIAGSLAWVRVSNSAGYPGLIDKGELFAFILSFVCMLFSLASLRSAKGPGIRPAKIGCIVLNSAYASCFVGLLTGYPVAY